MASTLPAQAATCSAVAPSDPAWAAAGNPTSSNSSIAWVLPVSAAPISAEPSVSATSERSAGSWSSSCSAPVRSPRRARIPEAIERRRVVAGAVAFEQLQQIATATRRRDGVRGAAVITGLVRIGTVGEQQLDQLEAAVGPDRRQHDADGLVVVVAVPAGVCAGVQQHPHPVSVVERDRSRERLRGDRPHVRGVLDQQPHAPLLTGLPASPGGRVPRCGREPGQVQVMICHLGAAFEQQPHDRLVPATRAGARDRAAQRRPLRLIGRQTVQVGACIQQHAHDRQEPLGADRVDMPARRAGKMERRPPGARIPPGSQTRIAP